MAKFESDIARKREQLQWRGKIYDVITWALFIFDIERDKIPLMDRLRVVIDRIANEYSPSEKKSEIADEKMSLRKMPLPEVQAVVLARIKSGLSSLDVNLAPDLAAELATVISDIMKREKELREKEWRVVDK